MKIRNVLAPVGLAVLLAGPIALAPVAAEAATKTEINRDANEALASLYKSNEVAAAVGKQAKAVLIFPSIVKAGFVFGGSYGEGVLKQGAAMAPVGYYNSVSASWGLQAGAQTYGYALFLMTDKAVEYLNKSDGWELGAGPTVVVVDAGLAANLSTTTLKDDAYAFAFDQKGLMAGLTVEGTKVSKINPAD